MYIPRNKNCKKNLVLQRSSVSSQVISTTVVDISGTEISYIPEANSSFVVYEFNIQFHNDPDINNSFYYELQKNDGSGYSPVGQGYRVRANYSLAWSQNTIEGKFVLNSWTGSNDLKMTIRSSSTSTEFTLHEDDAGNDFDPIIKMYSIM